MDLAVERSQDGGFGVHEHIQADVNGAPFVAVVRGDTEGVATIDWASVVVTANRDLHPCFVHPVPDLAGELFRVAVVVRVGEFQTANAPVSVNIGRSAQVRRHNVADLIGVLTQPLYQKRAVWHSRIAAGRPQSVVR